MRSNGRLDLVRGLRYPRERDADLALLDAQGRLASLPDYRSVFKRIAAGRAVATIASPQWASHYTDIAAGLQWRAHPLTNVAPQAIGLGVQP
jgi:hypothetical protein